MSKLGDRVAFGKEGGGTVYETYTKLIKQNETGSVWQLCSGKYTTEPEGTLHTPNEEGLASALSKIGVTQ